MEKKKSKKANLEKSKAVFLLIGLIIAIAFVASAFSWQSKKNLPIVSEPPKTFIDVFPQISRNDLIYQETKKEVNEKFEDEAKQITNEFEITNKGLKNMPDVIIEPKTTSEPIIEEIPEPEPDTIYVHTTEMPIFEGGTPALRRWIGENVNYPAFARENKIQGTIYLRFEVTKTGSIGKVDLQKGVDPIIDKEAIDVIKRLPKFKPGKNNGKKVNVWFSIPISFKIN